MPTPVWDHVQGSEIQHSLHFLTDVMQSATGHIQTRKLRRSPRHRVRSWLLVKALRRRQLESRLARYAGADWHLPLSMFGQQLQAPLAMGSTVIPATTADHAFVVGGHALLGDLDSDHRELVEIEAVGPTTITIVDATAHEWPAGAHLFPTRPAYLRDDPRLARFTGDDVTAEIDWTIDGYIDWRAFEWGTLYRGLPVLRLPPDWESDPIATIGREITTSDAQSGPVVRFDIPGVPFVSIEITATVIGTEAIADLYAMLYALAGRHHPVWVHSHARDFALVASAAAAATTIDVEATGLVDEALPATMRDIRIDHPDGTEVLRRITSVTAPAPGVERLQLDGAVGADMAPGDHHAISWLWLARQTSDVNTLNYWRGDIVDTRLKFAGFNHGF